MSADKLQMLAGNPNRYTFNSSSEADQAVSFVCLGKPYLSTSIEVSHLKVWHP